VTRGAASPALSLVVPVYDEEGNVVSLFGELTRVAAALGRPYEILFVNDGSRDATLERLASLATHDPHLRVVDLDGNFGEAGALSAGFAAARGDVVVTLDGDGQNDPADIPRLVAALEQGYDVASGWRIEREEAFLTRVLPSRIANGLIARLTGVPVHDCGCGLKAYRRAVLEGVQLPRGMNRFLPSILGVGPHRVVEVTTRDRPRCSGASHYGLSRVFVVFRDLLALPLLVRRPLPGRTSVRSLGVASWLLGAGGLALVAAGFRYPVALAAAAGALGAAAAVHAVRHNLRRFADARDCGVFRVRRILDHESVSFERRSRGLRVLGQEPLADVPSPVGRLRNALLRS
jgi:hypothetical protein